MLLADAHRRIEALQAETATLQTQLREIAKSEALLRKDVERLTDLFAHTRPNCPERTPRDEAQLAFERVVETFGDTAANDAAKDDTADAGTSSQEPLAGAPNTKPETRERTIKRRHRHGRRRLDLTRLPVEHVAIDPPEVAAAGGEGFVRIGEEVSDRLAFRPASYFRLRLVRGKWARRIAMETNAAAATAVAHASRHDVPCEGADAAPVSVDVPTPVLVAPLPEGVWPTVMADPSAVAQIVIAKYDDITPLHRQERISVRQGFALPRSTQCGWLAIAYLLLYRIVDAMLEDACATARCIAMDATGAPVRTKGSSVKRHVFVLIADRDHIVFRFAKEHSGQTVRAFLEGFHGELLADAAPIYDVLYRDEGMTEIACWFHCRRYFWRALETDRAQALEALAMIAQLFTIDAACKDIEMPCRTEVRAQSARPILAMFDAWIDAHRDRVDPRGPLRKAIGYYDNQRDALRRFLDDGRRPLDNGVSERALRNLVLGRHNWGPFANETGLRWYTTFRSLIASCALHGLNAQDYLEQLLRLAPHWPVTRMLELAPKSWATTIAGLDARRRLILARPWEMPDIPMETATTLLRVA